MFNFTIALLFISNFLLAQNSSNYYPILKGKYLGQSPPGKTAEIFAPGIISTELHDDAVPAFSPDGKEVFLRIVYKTNAMYHSKIFYMKEDKNGWTYPKIADFPQKQFHGVVSISLDGKRFYNSSSEYINGKFNLDINLYSKKEDKWNFVKSLNEINSENGDSYFFENNNNEFYWTAEKMRNDPEPSFFRSEIINDKYSKKEEINWFPKNSIVTFISSDNKYALLTMRDDKGSHDIYISYNINGTWDNPINMGENVNSPSMEKQAIVSHDGKYIFFVSSRKGEGTQPQKNMGI